MTFTIRSAVNNAVTWQPDERADPVSHSMTQVADALTESILTGTTTLAGHEVDESTLIELMNAMRREAGLTQCDQCRQWTDLGDLCGECAA